MPKVRASVDVEVAWEERAVAEQAVTDAEVGTAAEVERLLAERLAVKDVVQLTGLDQPTSVGCVGSTPTTTRPNNEAEQRRRRDRRQCRGRRG